MKDNMLQSIPCVMLSFKDPSSHIGKLVMSDDFRTCFILMSYAGVDDFGSLMYNCRLLYTPPKYIGPSKTITLPGHWNMVQ